MEAHAHLELKKRADARFTADFILTKLSHEGVHEHGWLVHVPEGGASVRETDRTVRESGRARTLP
jgi:hypothetical protein